MGVSDLDVLGIVLNHGLPVLASSQMELKDYQQAYGLWNWAEVQAMIAACEIKDMPGGKDRPCDNANEPFIVARGAEGRILTDHLNDHAKAYALLAAANDGVWWRYRNLDITAPDADRRRALTDNRDNFLGQIRAGWRLVRPVP